MCSNVLVVCFFFSENLLNLGKLFVCLRDLKEVFPGVFCGVIVRDQGRETGGSDWPDATIPLCPLCDVVAGRRSLPPKGTR